MRILETPPDPPTDGYVMAVPVGIKDVSSLMEALSVAGDFPDYFGRNWDALLDTLRDLSWISDRKVYLTHEDIPLDGTGDERTYIEIIDTAQSDWERPVNTDNVVPSPFEYVEHDLLICFPRHLARRVQAFL